MTNKLFILMAGLFAAVSVSGRASYGCDASDMRLIESPDSIPEDESEMGNDTIGKSRKNYAKGLDAMKYQLEDRYLNKGETFSDGTVFTRRWDDHLFLEGGAGAEQMIPPGANYHFDPLTTAHIGIGKLLNKLHSVRLLLNGALGYQRDKDLFLYKMGVKLDHLFSLTSYFNGYNPSRLLDISTVAGVGAQYAKLGKGGRSGKAFEAHLGLQLRFFTGPQGYVNVEPYYGLATDGMDLSENRNWRKVDMFYGANVNFVYYLHNNLSPEARARFIRNKTEGNYFAADSSLQSWRQPWFFEFSNGLSFVESAELSSFETMGYDVSMSAGKWLSPVIGLRLSASITTGTWLNTVIPESPSPYHPEYLMEYRTLYFGGRAEALINPFGFNDNYDWDSRYGVYAVLGGGIGRVMKYQKGRHLACRAESYTAGVHLWTRISSGLQLFIEPRYTHYIYKIPYRNVKWNKRFSDNGYIVSAGFTVTTRGMRFRNRAAEASAQADSDNRRIVVGIGGGTNLIQTKNNYDTGTGGFAYNGLLFGEYHFNEISAARLSFEYASFARTGMTSFTDYNMDYAADGYAPVQRSGLWNHRYFLGFVSLDYLVDFTTLCDGYKAGRLFELGLFAGPTCAIVFGENASLDTNERLQENHEVRQTDPLKSGACFGLNGGVKLTANVLPRFAVTFTPTIYLMLGDMNLPGANMLKIKNIETLNLGVQYKF